MTEKSDHDLLIEISTKVEMFNTTFIKHCEEDSSKSAIVESKLSSLHRRLDWIMPTAIISILLFIVGVGGFIINAIGKIN